MDVLTGPQGTAQQRDELSAAAGLLGLTVLASTTVWMTVDTLYRLPGWQACPTALADVQMAEMLCCPIADLVRPVSLRSAAS